MSDSDATLTARGSVYSAEVKASCIAALLSGEKPSRVSKEYGVPVGTLYVWKSRAKGDVPAVGPELQSVIAQLLVDYLTSSLDGLAAQSSKFSDESWLDKQDAKGLAILHGVMADKAVRLLQIFGKEDAGGWDNDTVT